MGDFTNGLCFIEERIYIHEYPKGLYKDFDIVNLGDYCKWECFKGYGGCSSNPRERVVDVESASKKIRTNVFQSTINTDPFTFL